MIRFLILVALLFLGGCDQAPFDGSYDDRNETISRKITVPGQGSPSLVVFGKPNSRVCWGTADRAREIFEGLIQSGPYKSGYSYLDVQNAESSYRAYFRESLMRAPKDARYVFCSGTESPLIATRCDLVGISEKGCFESGTYGGADLKTIDDTFTRIELEWNQVP